MGSGLPNCGRKIRQWKGNPSMLLPIRVVWNSEMGVTPALGKLRSLYPLMYPGNQLDRH